jgi:phage-related protein
MPETRVAFYKDDDGTTPLLDWLETLRPREAVAKCIALVGLLKEKGHELRRPHGDILEEGIHELRAHEGRVQLRMLYFFDRGSAVITHGFIKRGKKVPPKEIKRAKKRRGRYHEDPASHIHEEG